MMCRLTRVLLFVMMLVLSFSASAQTSRLKSDNLTVSLQNAALIDAFGQLNKISGYTFIYDDAAIATTARLSLSLKNATIYRIMDEVASQAKISYKIVDGTISVSNVVVNQQDVRPANLPSGVVYNADKQPLAGVAVVIKGTQKGTTTDANGHFNLNYGATDTLTINFLGYTTLHVAANGRTFIEATIHEASEQIGDVVVVGYGTQRKVNLTGSVASVSTDKLQGRLVSQTSQLLQGLAPGLTVTQSTGEPGAVSALNIRGVGTLGNSSPLVLIDGVEGDINSVTPDEIASISVLKDAASAAIYGSRAANGVILITTKRGSLDGFSITLKANIGWQRPTQLPEFLGVLDYFKYYDMVYANEGKGYIYGQDYIDNYAAHMRSDPNNYPDTDWQKETMDGSGLQQSYNLGFSGGTERIKAMGALTYINQDGIISNSTYDRYGARVNTDITLASRLNMGLDLVANRSVQTEPGPGFKEVFYQMNRLSPEYPAYYNIDGKKVFAPGWNGSNSVVMAKDSGTNTYTTDDVTVSAKLKYTPVKDLNISGNFAPRVLNYDRRYYNKRTILKGLDGQQFATTDKTRLVRENYKTNNYTLNLLVNYHRTLGKHFVSALVGYEQIYNSDDFFNASREGFVLPKYEQLDAGSSSIQKNSGDKYEWALQSYFGRINYSFDDRYLFEFNIRRDGSSRFAEGHRYGTFPSLSVGWRISEEKFAKDISWLDNLKITGSWGKLGNQDVGIYPAYSSIKMDYKAIIGYKSNDAAAQQIFANKSISWETTRVVNVGLEFSVLRNRLTGSFEYYDKYTTDILLKVPIPTTVGLEPSEQNAGRVRNRGWDMTLGYRDKAGKLNYSVQFTLSDVKNKVLDLFGTGPLIDGLLVQQEGYPINSIYGFRALGLFASDEEVAGHPTQFGNVAPGDIKYANLNDDDSITEANDRTVIGSTIPRYTYSAMINLDYKGFDLGIFFQGVGKVDGYLAGNAAWAYYSGGKIQKWQTDHWTPDNLDASYPRLTSTYTNNQQASSFWIKSGAYLRLKNIQIGYTLPQRWVGKIGAKNVRIYLSGENLFTCHNFYDGWDPESPVGAGTYYPLIKTYSFGLDIKF